MPKNQKIYPNTDLFEYIYAKNIKFVKCISIQILKQNVLQEEEYAKNAHTDVKFLPTTCTNS